MATKSPVVPDFEQLNTLCGPYATLGSVAACPAQVASYANETFPELSIVAARLAVQAALGGILRGDRTDLSEMSRNSYV